MLSNNEQTLSNKQYFEFDENDDLILPGSIWGEFRFIIFMIIYIIKHPNEREKEIFNLKRQFLIYISWLKNK